MHRPKTHIERRTDGWWIVGFDCGDIGPYRTKSSDEMRSDRKGLYRWYADQLNRSSTRAKRAVS